LGQYRSTNHFQNETPVLTGGSCQPILRALVQDVHGLRVYEPGLLVGDSAAQQVQSHGHEHINNNKKLKGYTHG